MRVVQDEINDVAFSDARVYQRPGCLFLGFLIFDISTYIYNFFLILYVYIGVRSAALPFTENLRLRSETTAHFTRIVDANPLVCLSNISDIFSIFITKNVGYGKFRNLIGMLLQVHS